MMANSFWLTSCVLVEQLPSLLLENIYMGLGRELARHRTPSFGNAWSPLSQALPKEGLCMFLEVCLTLAADQRLTVSTRVTVDAIRNGSQQETQSEPSTKTGGGCLLVGRQNRNELPILGTMFDHRYGTAPRSIRRWCRGICLKMLERCTNAGATGPTPIPLAW